MQSDYTDRMQTIQTYEQVEDTSALGRIHFWRVAIDMVSAYPLGIGLFNYEELYDRFDFTQGAFGTKRSVHSSHMQVLAETGFLGAIVYGCVFCFAFGRSWRIRQRSRQRNLSPEDQRLFFTGGNALIVSMTAFIVGGGFVAMALNDLTWLTFALVTSLDLISARACVFADSTVRAHQAVSAPQRVGLVYRPTG
jgi:O-antigen ligase